MDLATLGPLTIVWILDFEESASISSNGRGTLATVKEGANTVAVGKMVAASSEVGRYRWFICALLFFATTVNYMDRQVIGLLKPTLQAQLHWSEIDYANIVFAFQLAYAAGLGFVGRFVDWLGARKGFSIAVLVWSVAAMSHAAARSVFAFSAARAALGLGESASFPASIKSVAEWFPRKERALATGLFNCGANIGAIATPILIPWLTYRFGWPSAFIVTGGLGLAWLALWLVFYQSPEASRRLSPGELQFIRSDPGETTVPLSWGKLLGYRETWAFAIGKFLTDPIWWLYLFWVPDFLNRNYHVDLNGMMLPLLVIYNAATIGSIGGGWMSSALIRHGWTINRSRKAAMLVCALGAVPMIFAARASSLWMAVFLLSLATASHQGWSANIFTTASDVFPRSAVGTVVGIGGMMGAIGGMVIAKIVGYVLQWTGSYYTIFLLAGTAYLIALFIFQLLVPKLEPLEIV
jgi:MFS transporter, ACS family, aldohexuronate transporter